MTSPVMHPEQSSGGRTPPQLGRETNFEKAILCATIMRLLDYVKGGTPSVSGEIGVSGGSNIKNTN